VADKLVADKLVTDKLAADKLVATVNAINDNFWHNIACQDKCSSDMCTDEQIKENIQLPQACFSLGSPGVLGRSFAYNAAGRKKQFSCSLQSSSKLDDFSAVSQGAFWHGRHTAPRHPARLFKT
jgi:hypothetical protein